MFDFLKRDITYLHGVGPKRAEILKKEIGVSSFGDMLFYFPYKYVDRSRIYTVSEINGEMPYVQLRGRILSFEPAGEGYKKRLTAEFTDGTGVIELVWFKGMKFVLGKYALNTEYVIFGKPNEFKGKISIAHPDVDRVEDVNLSAVGLMPFYNTTEKMKRAFINSVTILKMQQSLIASVTGPLEETLTPDVLSQYSLMSLTDALRNVHFPESPELLKRARLRLKFEELFYLQLNIQSYVVERRHKYKGLIFRKVGDAFNGFYENNLPFPLTGAQKRVIKEIRRDLGSGRQMNRLLQGDVGSGKTLVALMTMLIAIDNGYQACMMAPTEILANQHFDTIKTMLRGMPLRVELLTGSVKGKRREEIFESLANGEVDILVGTHAVIEDPVCFHSLGFVIIDEQHRFGVAQRAKLWTKNDTPPHVLVMTATPIPRTLAMTVYGDLDVSVIDELPPGRKPVKTIHMYNTREDELYAFIRKQVDEGRQAYIVYPLIKESEKSDLKNLEDGWRKISGLFPQYRICKVHGRMKPAEKDAEMERFVSGECQIMVATTVIEVGVNVPNATVMIIENAERFGLSQLHQLRGRVGRGGDQSYCVLVTGFKLSEDTRKRIGIMVETNDGFEIAEADLKLRGPGDLEGTQQSGIAFDLKIASLSRDGLILNAAKEAAQKIISADPEHKSPYYAVLWNRLKEIKNIQINWGAIS